MDFFNRKQHSLYAEQCPVAELAKQYGTPLYIYSRATIERHWHAFDQAAGERPHLVCYAVKANSNIAVLNVLAKLGAGFDIVSVGELERVLKAGGSPDKMVFSGVAKTADEMRRALAVGVHCFNVESAAELERLNEVAVEMGVKAPVSLRVNPDVDAQTHAKISTGKSENKFGIELNRVHEVCKKAADMPGIRIVGLAMHIGSQLTETGPFREAYTRMYGLATKLRADGFNVEQLDLGGGLGIPTNVRGMPRIAGVRVYYEF